MNQIVRLVIWLYALLANLYPPAFRVDFKEEMTAVFAQTVAEAAERGRVSLTAACLREICDLPFNIAREHWHSLTKKELVMTLIKKPGWFFYSGWVVLTTLSIPLAFAITYFIIIQARDVLGGTIIINDRSHITEDWLAGYIFVPALALTTGLLQYLLLRRYLPRMGRWVGATTLGWLLAAVIGYLSTFLPGRILGANINWLTLLMIALMAGFVGLMQWLVLRRRVPRAGWWILATIAGWVAMRLASGEGTTGPLDIWYLGVLPAIATSFVLWYLFNRKPPKAVSET